ncbi:MAG: hypothetical protein QHH07_08360 [Sedimentisphaerales bacterium]|nr:hypothetical protein [Sedimentisphaerales bacterium]
MVLRFYSQFFSQASKAMGFVVMAVGLGLVCLGLLIILMPRLFAYIVAAGLIGLGLVILTVATKILWAAHKAGRYASADDRTYRVKVRVVD